MFDWNVRLEGHEGVHGLSSELVCGSDDGSLSDTGVHNKRRLNLSSGQPMARYVDDIYLTAGASDMVDAIKINETHRQRGP